MAIFYYFEMLLLMLLGLVCLCFLIGRSWKANSIAPTNWPLFGMLPELLLNAHRVHDYVTEFLTESRGNFEFKGPLSMKMDIFVTCDPANIHHILSKNFANYPKGPEFRNIFDGLGDGIFNTDDELWELHRKIIMMLLTHPMFQSALERAVWSKVETGLLPVLDHFTKLETSFDLQGVFQRFALDSISKLVLDYDPCSLSVDLPYNPYNEAFSDCTQAVFHRQLLPESCWKLQKWLGIGKEKKLKKASEAFDQLIYPCISSKQEKLDRRSYEEEQEDGFDFLTSLIKAYKGKSGNSGDSKKFLKETVLNLMFAGRDTTSASLTWFFWLVAKNPHVEIKIQEELKTKLCMKENRVMYFSAGDSRKLVYLHGAFCEALRLFPPVPLNHKIPMQSDVLPSGHSLPPNRRTILSFYSMGRMETIWGKDCLDFRPQRWISENGGMKHEPSFKFPAFNAGPRTCLGKEMSLIQMKIVAATIIHNYDIHLVEGHSVCPSDSVILTMKHGLKVKLSRRNA